MEPFVSMTASADGKNFALDDQKKFLFTVLETAQYLGLSRSMIYNLMEAGKLRYVKIGTTRRIPKSCCQELIEANLTGGWNIQTAFCKNALLSGGDHG